MAAHASWNSSTSWPVPPSTPRPPASETAATSSGPAAPPSLPAPMPASMIGYSIPSSSHSGVRNTARPMQLRLRLQVVARDRLGHHGRLGLALDLDRDLRDLLDHIGLDLFDTDEPGPPADS